MARVKATVVRKKGMEEVCSRNILKVAKDFNSLRQWPFKEDTATYSKEGNLHLRSSPPGSMLTFKETEFT